MIANKLKLRRQELKISQDKLSRHIGFRHRSNISKLEDGKLEWKLKDVIKACELLELELKIETSSNYCPKCGNNLEVDEEYLPDIAYWCEFCEEAY
jgi:DNA-binding XRE family transcriptional regulator